ncbi:MAG TPA: alpha/beta fold hydrolase [Alphaproteobacteria bacterium]|nr:alpha/beta fold hydrolase [Alphaproteobacteria bacterium]
MSDRIPLLLLPGLLCDSALWAPQRAALADVAETSVADLTRHDSVRAMADSVLAAAPERFALAGLSMGGYVALEIMRQAPGRVDRLALLDTSARPDTDETAKRRRGLISLARMGRFKGVTPRLLPMLLHPDRLDDGPLTGTVMDMAERVGQAAFIRQQTAILGRPDSRPGLAAIACPTLVLCGRQDALTPLEMSEELAAGIPGADLVVVEDCGHLSTLEKPDGVTECLRAWLRR